VTGWIVGAVIVAWVVYVHRKANRGRAARLAEAAGALRDDGLEVTFRSVAHYAVLATEGVDPPWAPPYRGPKPHWYNRVVEVTMRHPGRGCVCTTTYWRLDDDGEAAAYLAGIQAGIELGKP
jgi:hypothetical protein